MVNLHQETFYAKAYTFTTDDAIRIELDPTILLSDVNIHCYTNDCYYGSGSVMDGIIRANAVVWFTGVIRPYDLIFKNYTAGSNAKIVLTGVIRKG